MTFNLLDDTTDLGAKSNIPWVIGFVGVIELLFRRIDIFNGVVESGGGGQMTSDLT